ncbi:MAG: hypothetical protein R6V58_11700 [Planctomycetota bacterium]
MTSSVCLGVLLLAGSAVAAAPPRADYRVKGLDGAWFEPGKLRLALTVHERSGVARKGAVVTSGVPFPPGFLPDVKTLGVVDKDGNAVPSQAKTLIKWWEPTYDGSVQWALVSFVCDVPAKGTSTYYLTDDGEAKSPDTPLRLTKVGKFGAGSHEIATGPAAFVVRDSGDSLIWRAKVGGKDVLTGKGLRGALTSGAWPDRGLQKGSEHPATHEWQGVQVDEEGPVRVVLALKGRHKPGDKDGKFYDFTCRLVFETGSPVVRVIYTVSNGQLDPELIDGKRRAYVWPIEDASLVADLSLGDGAKVTTPAEGQAVGAPGLTVYQDSSGGDKWRKLGGGNYERWLSRYTGGKTVRGVTFRGYKVTSGDEELASGNAHPGVLDVSNGEAGVAVALRNFRVEYPSALSASGKRLRVGLFPGEFAEPFHLNNGARKSWDVRLAFHGAEAPDLGELHAVHDALLLFRTDPKWMVRCAAAGAWPAGLALFEGKGQPRLRRDQSKLDGIHAGWDWYGWISSWNAGGGHWNQSTCFAPWVLWGDGANFDGAEAHALWAADLCSIHYDSPKLATFWLMLRDWNWRENRLVRHTYPGYYNRDTWGRPDSGHMGMFMWPEYYLLTGDARCREAWEHLGIRARAFCWQYNHDDKSDGTGPLPRAINWCKKQYPDKNPKFRPATRYVGWPLYDLSQYYRLTGRPELLKEAQTVARGFRNTARMSPIGFMVTHINKKGDKSVYGHQGPFEEWRPKCASQCYAHFQQGIMTTGLVEYYLMSRDIEALDAMTAFADQTCHYSMIRDPQGNRRGWTYCFGDYWGPYTWDDCGGKAGFFASNFRILQPVGWIVHATGRSDYRAVLKDAYDRPRRGGFNRGVIAAWMAVRHPKQDATPPAAITDLEAEPLGGGKVKLTWTAPGDDGAEGRAAWYQVKAHTGRIVERIEGWPDRSPPLPTTPEEWHAKAEAFNAKQRAFWGARNAPDAPTPAEAGKTETMTLKGVAAGETSFAIKTWDDADNVSAISNVARVEVK